MSESTDRRHRGVQLHEETVELVDELKPEWMPRSAFVDGVVWMFYGHLDHVHGANRRLALHERDAICRLRRSGVDSQVLADAFGVSTNTIRQIQAADGYSTVATEQEGAGER